jgi:hypothetical protein
MPIHVLNDGTYNVYKVNKTDNQILITLKMYGRQTVKIKCDKPKKVISSDDGLIVESYLFLPDQGFLEIIVLGINMQGSRGVIKLLY